MQCYDDGSLFQNGISPNGYHGISTTSITNSLEVWKSLKEIYINFWLSRDAHWGETDYGVSTGQHAVLPEGKGKRQGKS